MLIVNRLYGFIDGWMAGEVGIYIIIYGMGRLSGMGGASEGRGELVIPPSNNQGRKTPYILTIQHSNNQTLNELIIALIDKQQISLCAFH